MPNKPDRLFVCVFPGMESGQNLRNLECLAKFYIEFALVLGKKIVGNFRFNLRVFPLFTRLDTKKPEVWPVKCYFFHISTSYVMSFSGILTRKKPWKPMNYLLFCVSFQW